jgi:hypothetical protein
MYYFEISVGPIDANPICELYNESYTLVGTFYSNFYYNLDRTKNYYVVLSSDQPNFAPNDYTINVYQV